MTPAGPAADDAPASRATTMRATTVRATTMQATTMQATTVQATTVQATTVQATVVALGEAGVLIRGAPGAGKTSLALALVAAAAAGRFARLVADDGVRIERHGARILARTPATIAGIAEVRGHGIVSVPHLSAVRLALVVDLVPRAHLERMPEPCICELLGVSLPRVAAESCNTLAASVTIAFVLPALQLTPTAGGGQRPPIVEAFAPGLGSVGGSARGDDR